MMKADEVTAELPLNDERLVVKVPRHVMIAVGHLNKQRDKAKARLQQAQAELTSLDAAIAALQV